MSLHKAIKSGKEHRKPWSYAKEVDPSTRNHGDDPWDYSNRTHQRQKQELEAKFRIKEFLEDEE